jgi:hypothetical protein
MLPVFPQCNNVGVGASITAIGRGSTVVGLLCVVVGSQSKKPWLLLAGKVLIGVGILLLIVKLWKRW